jgi:tetratricopeptide (TPR) repeat protein
MSVERALSLHRQGHLPEAASLYQAVLKTDRDQFDALHGLGILRNQQRRHEEARNLFRRALRQNPQSAEAEYNLAIALNALKQVADSELHYRRAVALRPDFFQAHNNLGNVLKTLGRRNEAIEQFRTALAVKPDFPNAHNNLGNALQAGGQREEAVTHYRQAIALQPNYAEAHNNLANVLRLLGRGAESLPHYERALAIDPDYVDAQYNYGNALKELGRFDDAAAAFRRTIALDPKKAGAWLDLVETQKISADDPAIQAIEKLVADKKSLKDADRLPLHFALGRVYDDLGRHDDAFRHFARGNAMRRREISYNEPQMVEYFSEIKRIFTPELMRDKAGGGDPSPVPLFILGMPRSGSTLVEQILATHPKVFGAGELEDMQRLAKTLPYPDGLPGADAERLREIGRSYMKGIEALGSKAVLISDKMPGNFFYVGLIRLILPNARIIHTQRNAVDTCLSCYSKLFVGQQNYSYEPGELGRYWRQYDSLMAHWRNILPEDSMLEIRYADVVADIETQARRLIAFCGLDWDDACLDFYKNKRPVMTASVAQVRRPIYQSSVGRWRAYERHLAPLLKELPADQVNEGGPAP